MRILANYLLGSSIALVVLSWLGLTIGQPWEVMALGSLAALIEIANQLRKIADKEVS